ncbi:alpha/beta hydrolase, partial [Streptomyces sp. ZEA17I]
MTVPDSSAFGPAGAVRPPGPAAPAGSSTSPAGPAGAGGPVRL